MSNMVIGVMIIILFFISMALTIIVSGQRKNYINPRSFNIKKESRRR